MDIIAINDLCWGKAVKRSDIGSSAFSRKQIREKKKDLGLLRNHIYNANESVRFWKLLPDHILVHVKETSAAVR